MNNIDLDRLQALHEKERKNRYLTDAEVTQLRNALPALIAEVRALRVESAANVDTACDWKRRAEIQANINSLISVMHAGDSLPSEPPASPPCDATEPKGRDALGESCDRAAQKDLMPTDANIEMPLQKYKEVIDLVHERIRLLNLINSSEQADTLTRSERLDTEMRRKRLATVDKLLVEETVKIFSKNN